MADPIVKRNKANFRRFMQEVVVEGDMSLLPELVAPEMRVLRAAMDSVMRLRGRPVPDDRRWNHEEFKRAYDATVGGLPDYRRTIEDIHGEGDVVWARWTSEYRHHDERLGVPATNRLVRVAEVGMVRFDEDGRITEGWFCNDPLDLYQQIGEVTVAPKG